MRFLSLFFVIVFAGFSWFSLSGFNYMGSNESVTMLSKRPSLLEWPEGKVQEDSFADFKDEGWKLKSPPDSKPTMYLKTSSSIWPVYLHARASALPHLLIRGLSRLTSPSNAVALFAMICSLITLFASYSWIRKNSGDKVAVAFLGFALLTPHFFYFLNGINPDQILSCTLAVSILALLEKNTRNSFLWAAVLAGLGLIVKSASLIFFPVYVLFYRENLKAYKKEIFLGMALPLLFLALTLNFREFGDGLSARQEFGKSPWFPLEVTGLSILYSILPETIFLRNFTDMPSFLRLCREETIVTWVLLFIFLISFAWLCFKLLDRSRLKKTMMWILFYLGFVSLIARELDDDLFNYLCQGSVIFVILIFGSVKSPQIQKILWIPFAMLIMVKTISLVRWERDFHFLTQDLKGAIAPQEVLVRELMRDVPASSPLYLTSLMEVGQLEFFSGEQILPLHLKWKFQRGPTKDEYKNFLVALPQKEIYLLLSWKRDEPTFKNFDLLTTLPSGAHAREVKSYLYPSVQRSYKLIQISKE